MLGKMVREFNKKHGFSLDNSLEECADAGGELSRIATVKMSDIASILQKLGDEIKQNGVVLDAIGDPRLYGVHLILEEVGEAIAGIAAGDVKDAADGLGDAGYVIANTAERLGIPFDSVVAEIHASNMTKMVRDPMMDPRMRTKGPDYVPPDILGAISRGIRLREVGCAGHHWVELKDGSLKCGVCGDEKAGLRVPPTDGKTPPEELVLGRLSEVTQEEALRQGGWAYALGVELVRNPYTDGDATHWWRDGWKVADESI